MSRTVKPPAEIGHTELEGYPRHDAHLHPLSLLAQNLLADHNIQVRVIAFTTDIAEQKTVHQAYSQFRKFA